MSRLAIEWTDHDQLRPFSLSAAAIALGAVAMSRLGLPRVSLMWPMYQIGLVAPSCGLTRGVVALARADFAAAWRWNPASYLVALGVLAAAVRTIAGVATHRWFHPRVRPSRAMFAAAMLLLALLWIRQQANADLLISTP